MPEEVDPDTESDPPVKPDPMLAEDPDTDSDAIAEPDPMLAEDPDT